MNGYEQLQSVLDAAFKQASEGKGKERHATDNGFEDQPIMQIQDLVGKGFSLGQAIKKIQESQRMDTAAAERELLGAIVYIAAAIIHQREDEPKINNFSQGLDPSQICDNCEDAPKAPNDKYCSHCRFGLSYQRDTE